LTHNGLLQRQVFRGSHLQWYIEKTNGSTRKLTIVGEKDAKAHKTKT